MKGKKWLIITIAVLNVLLIATVVFLWITTDRKGPVIEFAGNDTIYVPGMSYDPLYEGISARDNTDGDVTDRIVIEKVIEDETASTATVTYAASDRSGNVTRMSRVFAAKYDTDIEENVTESEEEAAASDEVTATEETAALEETATEGNSAEAPDKTEGSGDATGAEPAEAAVSESTEPEEARKLTLDDLTEEEKKALQDEALAEAQAEVRKQQQRDQAVTAKAAQAEAEKEAAAAIDMAKPYITLKNTSIKTIPGQKPMWVDAIGGLHDDKDSYAQLFATLKTTKFDYNTPGTYSVGLTVTDSDKNESDPVYVSVVVK